MTDQLEVRSPQKNSNTILSLSVIVLGIAAAFFLYVNLRMPLVGEDYTLTPWSVNSVPPTILGKIQTISRGVYYAAIMWSPRIGEALSTITSVFPKPVFDLINTMLILWLVIVLFALMYGRFPVFRNFSDCFSLFSIIFLIITLFPLFGQVFIWKAGVTNHLWGVIFALSFILPFRLNYSRRVEINSTKFLILFILVGFVAGLTVENVTAVVFGFLVLYYLYSLRVNQISKKYIFPILSNAVGASILLFSPGTTYRRNYYSQFGYDGDYTGIALYINRFVRVHTDLLKITWPLLIVFGVSFLIFLFVRYRSKQMSDQLERGYHKDLIALAVMFLMAYFTVLIMLSISYQSDQRRGFAFFWLMIIGQIAFFWTYILANLTLRISVLVFSSMSILLLFHMINIVKIYEQFHAEDNSRQIVINRALATGETEIKLPPITMQDSRVIETREILSDLGDRIAGYYGFEKVEILK